MQMEKIDQLEKELMLPRNINRKTNNGNKGIGNRNSNSEK